VWPTESRIQIGLDLYEDLISRIPRAECREIFTLVRGEALSLDKDIWIDVMGSYRRGAETSGDVDMLITRDTADGKDHAGVLPRLVSRLKAKGIITHDVSCLPGNVRLLVDLPAS
jgi:DNA polymerase lambda